MDVDLQFLLAPHKIIMKPNTHRPLSENYNTNATTKRTPPPPPFTLGESLRKFLFTYAATCGALRKTSCTEITQPICGMCCHLAWNRGTDLYVHLDLELVNCYLFDTCLFI